MNRIQYLPLFVALALFGSVACSASSPPTSAEEDEALRKGRRDAGSDDAKTDGGAATSPEAAGSDPKADGGDAASPEICGDAPPLQLCIACPNGVASFKQINGKPTCECCSTTLLPIDAGPCCDPATKPPPGIEGTWCCGDGSWQYDIGSGDPVRSCSGFGGVGKVCGS